MEKKHIAKIMVIENIYTTIGTLIAEIVSMALIMYYENKIIHYSYREQLQDLLPSLMLSTLMGGLVYLIHFLPIHKGFVLVLQIVIGMSFYLVVSYTVQFKPFGYSCWVIVLPPCLMLNDEIFTSIARTIALGFIPI